MNIRRATSKDIHAVAGLWNVMIRETLWTFTTALKDDAAIMAYVSGPGDIFVAETDGTLAGFAAYSQFRNGPGYAQSMEHSIVVADAYQGQNLGRRLMEAIEADARTKGYHTMIGGISSANPRGEAFHSAMGYTTIGTLAQVGRKDDTWLDLILMQKML